MNTNLITFLYDITSKLAAFSEYFYNPRGKVKFWYIINPLRCVFGGGLTFKSPFPISVSRALGVFLLVCVCLGASDLLLLCVLVVVACACCRVR